MWLDDFSNYLGWPRAQQVKKPRGGGPGRYARLVEQKIGKALSRLNPNVEVETGILSADAQADTSESPLAIVCQFSQRVGDEVLMEAQRLSWNFTRVVLLITLEPDRVQAWTCTLAPKQKRGLEALRVLPPLVLEEGVEQGSLLQTDAAQALHWVNLISGEFVRQREKKFRKDERADTMLVANLRSVRSQLLEAGLNDHIEVCHSLLARLIFTQFLFQRRDNEGHPAISQNVLQSRFDGRLKRVYEHKTALETILRDKAETYALFKWLNEKFNGDLFTGKGRTDAEREREWQKEKNIVTQEHLNILADFVNGEINLANGQRSLWREYSFDTLPLEFISSVYEEFLNEDQKEASAYYTPPHLVDFVLDGVLPWGGKKWDLRVLDPCCGSGIFLVKSFQRLVQRWRNAHVGEEPKVEDLRSLLENNLMGVDRNSEAVRVAAFSLCLALCDEIDPRYYWKRTFFPPLRDERLIHSDFFAETHEGFRTYEDAKTWDLIVGNAPWRSGGLSDDAPAIAWAERNAWPVAAKNVGPVFLSKATALCKTTGTVSMILPAMPLLYQRSTDPILAYRKKLFSTCTVEEVVSFTHLRAYLFPGISARACLMTLQPKPSDPDDELTYICPKPQYDGEDESLITINPQDMHRLTHQEAVDDPFVWSVFLVGSRRDWHLIRRLSNEMTLSKLEAKNIAASDAEQCLRIRAGIQRSSKRTRDDQEILNRRILEGPNFPVDSGLVLMASSLPVNQNAKVEETSASNYDAFAIPQLLIKHTVIKSSGRFQAKLVHPEAGGVGVIASKRYLSVHQCKGGDGWLRSACLALNSRIVTYFGLLASSRMISNRAEALSNDILGLPLPAPDGIPSVENISLEDVDTLVERAFSLTEAESALVADLLDIVYREGGKEGNERPGRMQTRREQGKESSGDLYDYAEFLVRTLRATFGRNRAVRATVFEEQQGQSRLPLRLVALHLDWPEGRQIIRREEMNTQTLRAKLAEFFKEQMGLRSRQGEAITAGIGFQRVARLFVTHISATKLKVPTVLFLKPDQRRYWTRSQALRDADELAATITTAGKVRRTKA